MLDVGLTFLLPKTDMATNIVMLLFEELKELGISNIFCKNRILD